MGATFPFLIGEPRAETIRGFHATTQTMARQVLAGADFVPSVGQGEWLGHGVYFWTDEKMAWWWADNRKLKSPAVIEARIILGYCLDLTNVLAVRAFVSAVHRKLVDDLGDAGPVLENDGDDRRLDCAVYNKAAKLTHPPVESVLAHFAEGDPVFPGTTLRGRTHVQICVRNLSNICYPKDVGRRPV